MKGTKLPVLLLLFFAVAVPTLLQAQPTYPLVYREVLISLKVNEDGSALVSYKLTMLNKGSVPVVPGYGIIRVAGGEISGAKGLNLRTGRKLDVEVSGDKLRFGVWDVIKPNRSISVEVSFKISNFMAKGLLFSEYSYETTLSYPTERCRMVAIPPPGGHVVSGTSSVEVKNLKPGTPVRISGEISSIPLPRSPIKWYIPFWVMIAVLISVLLFILRKKRIT